MGEDDNVASTHSKEYQKLLDKRENAARAITFHSEKVAKLADTQVAEAQTRMLAIETAFERFKNLNEKLEDEDEFKLEHLKPSSEDVIDIFIIMVAKIREITKDILIEQSILNSTPNRNRFNMHQEIKLPRIEIPTFDGSYEDWVPFYDAFNSIVDSNPNLSDRNKMHYLKSALTGTALAAIGRLKVTEDHFKSALKTLKDRFNNKRAIVNSCLKTLMNQQKMKKASAQEIRVLIDTTKESTQTLESLNIFVADWDAVLVYVMQTKMDAETLREWENHLGGSTEIPKFTALIQFLETRFRILDIGESDNYLLPNAVHTTQSQIDQYHSYKPNPNINSYPSEPSTSKNYWQSNVP